MTSFVQVKTGSWGTSQTSVNAVFNSGVTAGSCVVIAVVSQSAGALTVTNSAGDAATDSGAGNISDGNLNNTVIVGFFTPTAGVTTFTIHIAGGSSVGSWYLYEIGGLSSASFDKVAHATATGTAASSGATGTQTNSNDAAIQFFTSYDTITPTTSGFTDDGFINPADGGHNVLSSNASITTTAAIATSNQWIAWAVTIKGTSAGGAPPVGWFSKDDTPVPRRRVFLEAGPSRPLVPPPFAVTPATDWMQVFDERPARRPLLDFPPAPPILVPRRIQSTWGSDDPLPRRRALQPDPGPFQNVPATAAVVAPPTGWLSTTDVLPRRISPQPDPGPFQNVPTAVVVAPLTGWFGVADDLPKKPSRQADGANLPIAVPVQPTRWLAAFDQTLYRRTLQADAVPVPLVPPAVAGIAGMAWAGCEPGLLPPFPKSWLLSSQAWPPQVIIQVIPPPTTAVYANYIIGGMGTMTSIPGNPPS